MRSRLRVSEKSCGKSGTIASKTPYGCLFLIRNKHVLAKTGMCVPLFPQLYFTVPKIFIMDDSSKKWYIAKWHGKKKKKQQRNKKCEVKEDEHTRWFDWESTGEGWILKIQNSFHPTIPCTRYLTSPYKKT